MERSNVAFDAGRFIQAGFPWRALGGDDVPAAFEADSPDRCRTARGRSVPCRAVVSAASPTSGSCPLRRVGHGRCLEAFRSTGKSDGATHRGANHGERSSAITASKSINRRCCAWRIAEVRSLSIEKSCRETYGNRVSFEGENASQFTERALETPPAAFLRASIIG